MNIEKNVTAQSSDGQKPLKPAEKTSGEAKEFGGPKGPEPTRYGDWEQKGRCTDF